MSAITVEKVQSPHGFECWIVKGNTFEWKSIIKSCGFWFDYDGKKTGFRKVWYTRKQEVAVKLSVPDVVESLNKDRQREVDEANASIRLSKQTDAPEGFDPPIADGQEYLPYQKAGIKFISSRPNSLLADDMGVGKTIQAIGLINLDESIKKVLVLCPLSVRRNWVNELDRFLCRDITREAVNGNFPESDIVVCNYDQVRKWHQEILSVNWDLLICDESHALKNQDAQRTQMVLGVKKFKDNGIKASRKLFVTGTPILNRPKEIFTVLQVLDPDGLGKNFFHFADRYCGAYRDRFGYRADGATNLDELQQKLRSKWMIRRLKSEVLTDLPDKIRQPIVLPDTGMTTLAKAEARAGAEYDAVLEELAIAKELAKTDKDYEAKLSALIDKRKILFSEVSKKRHQLGVAKIPLAIEHSKNLLEQREKIVIFAHHSDVLDSLKEAFGAEAVLVRSGVSDDARNNAITSFQNDPNIRVFLGGIRSAGVGITLTAADTVLFIEQDWTPGLMTQAEDRCHRRGQKNSVLIQFLLIEGTYDAKIANMLARKGDVVRTLLDDGAEMPDPEQFEAPVTAELTKKQIDLESVGLEPDQVVAIHEALRELSSVCDYAKSEDQQGFNKLDTRIGKCLASVLKLSPRQAVLGKKIVVKYQRQYGADLLARIKGEVAV